jgi:hypothetical protein
MPDDPEKTLQELRQRIATEVCPSSLPRHCARTSGRIGMVPSSCSRLSPEMHSAYRRRLGVCFIGRVTQSGHGGDGDRTREQP